MTMNQLTTHFSTFATPALAESPLRQRIRLALQRGRSYPMDSLDFVLADLERPATLIRHADFCTGDLSGRYLDFLAAAQPIDATDADRMDRLFERILTNQQPDGTFVREGCAQHGVWDAAYKLFIGLLRYYLRTGNGKALVAAQRNAEYIFAHQDAIREACDKRQLHDILMWVVEPMALLYGITGDPRCLELCRMIAAALPSTIDGKHSHGLMTTLRGLQFAALYTGDAQWNEIPERMRREIVERSVWPDGNIPEIFPTSGRNEGCSIADWIMLNLYAGFITGSDEAYEQAENSLHNALYLNQIVNGGFGHRNLAADRCGYGESSLNGEAWWCCLHNAGLAMLEFAAHAVTLRGDELRVNLLVPGTYTLPHEGRTVSVTIGTRYPESAEAVITVTGAPASMKTRIRIPACIAHAAIETAELPGGGIRHRMHGRLGYRIETGDRGTLLRYGPLVLAPLCYSDSGVGKGNPVQDMLQGYIPEEIRERRPMIVAGETDADGFVHYPKEPRPVWNNFEEGAHSRLAYDNLSVNVPLAFADGTVKEQRFLPLCYSTTTLHCESVCLPVVFGVRG